jgi:hypothetical protein
MPPITCEHVPKSSPSWSGYRPPKLGYTTRCKLRKSVLAAEGPAAAIIIWKYYAFATTTACISWIRLSY